MGRPWGLADEAELELDKDIEWFRPDPRRRLVPLWGKGSVVMIAGWVLTGYALLALNRPGAGEDPLLLTSLTVGLLLILVTMLRVVFRTVRILGDETCVGLRTDGLLHRSAEGEITIIPWRAIDEIAGDDQHHRLTIITELPELAELVVDTAGLDLKAESLAQRLFEARRRALMGLL